MMCRTVFLNQINNYTSAIKRDLYTREFETRSGRPPSAACPYVVMNKLDNSRTGVDTRVLIVRFDWTFGRQYPARRSRNDDIEFFALSRSSTGPFILFRRANSGRAEIPTAPGVRRGVVFVRFDGRMRKIATSSYRFGWGWPLFVFPGDFRPSSSWRSPRDIGVPAAVGY